jgi:hypothetical protein
MLELLLAHREAWFFLLKQSELFVCKADTRMDDRAVEARAQPALKESAMTAVLFFA